MRRNRTLAGLEPLEHRRVMAAGDLLQTIASPSTTAGARFGYSLSLSNDTLLVGTPNGSGSGEGAAFTFDPASGDLLSKYSSSNAQFGYPSAISGDYLLVNEGGAVRVYSRSSQSLLRTVSNPDYTRPFGGAIAASGNLAVIGSTTDFNYPYGGLAYVFELSTGELIHTLRPPAAKNQYFGSAVAMSDNYVAVISDRAAISGAPGRELWGTRVFVYSASSGELVSTFNDPRPSLTGGGRGYSTLTMWGDKVVAGLPDDGVVHVIDPVTGTATQTFGPSVGGFGRDVEVFGDALAVGAGYQYGGLGSVRIYDLPGGELLRSIDSPAPLEGDNFGNYLDMTEKYLAVSASDRPAAQGTGEVYLFDATWYAPTLTLPFGKRTYIENSKPVLLNTSASVTDPDNAHFAGGSLTIANPNAGSTDRLSISGQGTAAGQIGLLGDQVRYGGVVIGTYRGGRGNAPLTFSFNANATPTAVSALLQRITFFAGGENPLAGRRALRYTLNDGEGNLATATRYVTVVAVSDPPALTLATSARYVENGLPVRLDPAAQVTDADSRSFLQGGIVVNIVGGATASDRVGIRNRGTAAGAIGTANGKVLYGGKVIGDYQAGTSLVVTFTAESVTPAIAQELLRNVTFYNVSENPSSVTRTLSVTVDDGQGGSTQRTLTVSVEPVNDPLRFELPPVRHYVELSGQQPIATSAVLVDADLPDFDYGTIVVANGEGADPRDRLQIRSGARPGEVTVSGNQILLGGRVCGTFSGGDAASGPLRIELSRVVTLSELRRVLAGLTFTTEAGYDYVADVNTRHLQVQLLDDSGAAFTSDVLVQLHPDAPEIHQLPPAADDAPLIYHEDSGLVPLMPQAVVVNYSRPNFDGGELTLSVVTRAGATDQLAIRQGMQGGHRIQVQSGQVLYDGSHFATIAADSDPTHLRITFNASAGPAAVQALVRSLSFAAYGNNPRAGARPLDFTLSDGVHEAAATDLPPVEVVVSNDAPHVTGAPAYDQMPGSVSRPFANSRISDPDDVDVDGAVLRIAMTSPDNSNRLLMGGRFSHDSDLTVRLDGLVIGSGNEYGGQGTDPLVITFNENATLDIIQRLVQALRLSIGSGTSLEVIEVTLTLTDIHGAVSAPTVATANITRDVAGVNDPPVITGGQFYYQSRGTVSQPFAYSKLSDPDDSDYNGAVLHVVTTSAYQQNRILMGDLFSRGSGQIRFDGVIIGLADDAGGKGNAPLVITFNEHATFQIVQWLIQSLHFEASEDAGPETGLKITVTITDIHGATSAPSETIINVT